MFAAASFRNHRLGRTHGDQLCFNERSPGQQPSDSDSNLCHRRPPACVLLDRGLNPGECPTRRSLGGRKSRVLRSHRTQKSGNRRRDTSARSPVSPRSAPDRRGVSDGISASGQDPTPEPIV